MKKLDLKFKIKDLSEAEGEYAAKFLAATLISEKSGDPIKYFDWAMDLYKLNAITVDDADFDKIKSVVTVSEAMPLMVKAQILKYMITVKDVIPVAKK